MKLLNENDVHDMYESGDIGDSHAVDLMSQFLKNVCDAGIASDVIFEPKNIVQETSKIVDIEELHGCLGLENCVMDSVIAMCEHMIRGCEVRVKINDKCMEHLQIVMDDLNIGE